MGFRPRKTSPHDSDRYLVKRNGYFSYSRRIPTKLQGIDERSPSIRVALGTSDLAQARAQRDILERADNELWGALIVGVEKQTALQSYNRVVATASALGFTYRTSAALLAAE